MGISNRGKKNNSITYCYNAFVTNILPLTLRFRAKNILPLPLRFRAKNILPLTLRFRAKNILPLPLRFRAKNILPLPLRFRAKNICRHDALRKELGPSGYQSYRDEIMGYSTIF
ncbi:hypothetical protein [Lysinibacillus sp. JNUCC 51]|uniref:hypothetical protein n=1 Tax=Lysinibacillus sp. JNUCC-51 TaxID=2792479 RepID=UPI001935C5BD|nr:hypothetical protein JNUCC51_05055 [Lysinibacillus sp. JNUCC-51]